MIEIVPNWHPLFVHFTVALFSLSVLFFIIQRPLAETEIGDNFLLFARYTLGLGVLFTIGTVIAGIDAYNTVEHDTPSHEAMKDHRLWALITAGVFLVAWLWSLVSFRTEEKAGAVLLVLLLVGGGLLVTTGHKGSLLVYYYGLGVETLPATDEHDHGAHDHGDSGGHDHGGGEGADHPHDESSTSMSDDGHAHDHSDSAPHDHADEQPAAKPMNDGHSHAPGEGHDDSHSHSPQTEMQDSHEHASEEAHSHDSIDVEPEVVTEDGGIVRETLPEVEVPTQPAQ